MCLTPDALNLMPTVRYREKEDTHTPKQVTGLSCCSICTEDFQGGVEVRSLPCRHIFHPSCVDPWLLERSLFCPLCRANVAAGIISVTETEVPARPRRTSTQELLPLANVSTIQSDGPGTAVPPRRYQPSLPTISDVLEEVGPAYR
ncbi:Receptor-like proteiny region, transmembrane domain- and RING domain-containing protein 2 [Fusarium oxysporum f. sp. conglutinans]|nr:Receptor-like proteiny region, transmembrane domain- and RING domain-containing protein 2 [Fusarium oxysporum f. sp. conglutinans]